jgi:hypothetical protein
MEMIVDERMDFLAEKQRISDFLRQLGAVVEIPLGRA